MSIKKMQLIVESNIVIPIGALSINARVYGAYTQVMITILYREKVRCSDTYAVITMSQIPLKELSGLMMNTNSLFFP